MATRKLSGSGGFFSHDRTKNERALRDVLKSNRRCVDCDALVRNQIPSNEKDTMS